MRGAWCLLGIFTAGFLATSGTPVAVAVEPGGTATPSPNPSPFPSSSAPSPSTEATAPPSRTGRIALTTTTYTVTDGQLCSTSADGVVTKTGGAVTVNLDKAAPATELMIANSGAWDCLNTITSLSVTSTASSTVSTLRIDRGAFNQDHTIPSLQTVTFPSELEVLSIGEYAFQQTTEPDGTDGTSTTLTSVTFPTHVGTLTIGRGAFKQEVIGNASTSLSTITMPTTAGHLSIDSYGFEQNSFTNSPLESVTFPQSLGTLSLAEGSFSRWMWSADHLTRFTFPFTAPPTSVSLASYIAGPNLEWVWFGPDGYTGEQWSASGTSYRLKGYRKVTFHTLGGSLNPTVAPAGVASAANARFAYPDGTWRDQPGVFALGKNTDTWKLPLPTAIRTGYTFKYWCESTECTSGMHAGSIYHPAATTQTLTAIWAAALPPTTPEALANTGSAELVPLTSSAILFLTVGMVLYLQRRDHLQARRAGSGRTREKAR